MRIFKTYKYRLTKNDDFNDLIERAIKVVEKIHPSHTRRLLHLDDSGYGKISAVERVIKKFPELAKYKRYIKTNHPDLPDHYRLSNTPEYVQNEEIEESFIDINIFLAIANGIPKSYPFFYATFIFDELNWFGKQPKHNRSSLLSTYARHSSYNSQNYYNSAILLSTDWGYTKREKGLEVVVELPVPDESAVEIPSIPSRVQELLNYLGKVKLDYLTVLPTEHEKQKLDQSRVKALEVVDRYRERINEILRNIHLTHIMDDPIGRSVKNVSVSPKQSLLKYLKPLGYTYLSRISGQGCYFLGKRTKRNNQIKLLFDFAPLARTVSYNIEIEGLLWSHWLHMKFYPEEHNHDQAYSVNSQETLDKLVQNVADIVPYYENTFINEIENIYSASPAWFEYQK